MKDYDCTIKYHLGKANVVADALSKKIMECSIGIIEYEVNNLLALRAMNTTFEIERNHLLATLHIRPSMREQIQSVQMEDPYLRKMKEKVEARINF